MLQTHFAELLVTTLDRLTQRVVHCVLGQLIGDIILMGLSLSSYITESLTVSPFEIDAMSFDCILLNCGNGS